MPALAPPAATAMDDHYSVLGVTQSSALESIRSAYKQLSLTCHPDKIRLPHNASRKEEAAARANAQTRWARIEQVGW